MDVPEIHVLAHKADSEVVAGFALLVSSGVVIYWVDGVIEQLNGAASIDGLRTTYGDQYVVLGTQALGVVRYVIKETNSEELKGFAFCFPGAQVVIAWNDKTLEVWDKDAKLDAVLAQYAFQFTFQCLDQ